MKLSKIGLGVLAAGILCGQTHRSVANGETIYRQRCGGCHGLDGKAKTAIGKKEAMRDLTSSEVQKEADNQLEETITIGRGRMPAYGTSLKDEDIRSLVAYIRTMGKTGGEGPGPRD